MSRSATLADAYLAIRPGSAADPVALDRALADHLAAGRAAWSGVDLAGDGFAEYLARRSPDGDPVAALAELYITDLYLACGCARGVPAALAAFDRRCLPEIAVAVARVDSSPAFLDEITQMLRAHVLVGAAPRIANYLGQGPLVSWLRVAALRIALGLRRGPAAATTGDSVLELLPASGDDPELAAVKARCGAEVRAALRDAFASLASRERNVLRLYFIEDLGIEAIGTMYGVHASTVSRWIAKARMTVLDAVRDRVARVFALPAGELDSLLGLVRSQLDVSLHDLLA